MKEMENGKAQPLMKAGLAERFMANIDDRFLDEVMQAKQKSKVLRGPWGMALKVAACLALVTVVGISSLTVATAAGSLRAYEMLYALDPYLAERMSPVMESCVDQGIEMRVAGIYVHGEIVDIYVTMQDLEANRLDGTADLFDSYSIHTNIDQWGGCTLVDFDEESCTATFLIKAGLYDQKIDGKKMTFSVNRFLSGKQEAWVNLPQIDLSQVCSEQAESGQREEVLKIVQSHVDQNVHYDNELEKILIPNQVQTFAPVDGAKITAYGLVDGKLHVQVYYENVHGRDDHGDIQIVDANGMEHVCSGVDCFWDKDRFGRYEEYEFDVPEEELSEYSVIGYFSTGAQLYEGNWKITFPIVNKEE